MGGPPTNPAVQPDPAKLAREDIRQKVLEMWDIAKARGWDIVISSRLPDRREGITVTIWYDTLTVDQLRLPEEGVDADE